MVYQGLYQGLQQGLVQGIGTGYGPAPLADFDFTDINNPDPRGHLTTVTRSGSIRTRTSASTANTYGADELPIAWSPLLNGGAGGYGLLCNSALTNLLTHSDDLTGWTNNNSTDAQDVAASPEPGVDADSLTASAANGNVTLAFTVSPSTAYTFPVWIKRNGGSDVEGEIRLQDTNAVTETVQAFTATDTWQRIKVTHTMGGAGAAGQAMIQVDTSGESILVWDMNAILGTLTIDCPGVPTSGATATLAVPDYLATFSAGLLARASLGELEAVFSRYYEGTDGIIYDVRGAGNADRRYGRVSGDFFRAYTYDSTSSLESFIQLTGSFDMIGQEVTTIHQWSDAGSLVGGAEGYASKSGSVSGFQEGSTAGTFTSAETLTSVQVGRDGASTQWADGIIQRIRIWGGPR